MYFKPTNPPTDCTAYRYNSLDQVVGKIYQMCKDQHGCRFLQKKLEENNGKSVDIIFEEVYEHIVELMTDPFGNYLCQKLIEYCNDSQRCRIVQRVSPSLVVISKNMHGTRAVQKMIEHLSSTQQVQLVVEALQENVVDLIQDLNGNHVIQRCLNRLTPADKQFVYDAVAQHCVEVATHRHGCCVMQRCIDHASPTQRNQLIKEITACALKLVQDPYGNYVIQYVLELQNSLQQEAKNNLIMKFMGHLGYLSTQKFSSNVIEKCVEEADETTRTAMTEELVSSSNLASLLQDPYGNYVIQTALSHANTKLLKRMVEAIQPHLPALRNTPYGKRIQTKIMREANQPIA